MNTGAFDSRKTLTYHAVSTESLFGYSSSYSEARNKNCYKAGVSQSGFIVQLVCRSSCFKYLAGMVVNVFLNQTMEQTL